jgi:4a-hydroxytetrahydrobiopterin dehydratase
MNDWKEENQALEKTYVFDSFEDAIQFMVIAAPEISALDHHPTWTNTYNRLHVRLTTHDSGNQVTEKDWALARILDAQFERFL